MNNEMKKLLIKNLVYAYEDECINETPFSFYLECPFCVPDEELGCIGNKCNIQKYFELYFEEMLK